MLRSIVSSPTLRLKRLSSSSRSASSSLGRATLGRPALNFFWPLLVCHLPTSRSLGPCIIGGSILKGSKIWERIFKDPMATAAAIDRLVHHATILEFNVPSYRTRKRRRPDAAQSGEAVDASAG